jgi:protein YibB
MSDISIVTAFFDIGRGSWTPDKGFPHYIERTTDTYFERFGHMAKLDNDMVVFTTEDLKQKVLDLRGDKKTTVISVDFHNSFGELRQRIQEIQSSQEFQSRINPSQIKSPEYWNADYVLVNALKSSFVKHAIQQNILENEMIAWIDFGYCRTPEDAGKFNKWSYNFDKDKIHFFSLKKFEVGDLIENAIFNNTVYITGPHFIAHKDNWPKMEAMIHHHLDTLLNNGLVDDDQTLMLMSCLGNPELFEIHPISDSDWFCVFRNYNESIS